MFVRSLQDVEVTDRSSGTNHRLLTEKAWALPSVTRLCGPIRCHLSNTAITSKPAIASLERALSRTWTAIV